MPEAKGYGSIPMLQSHQKGTIVVVDAHGTFFQQEEPSYDIEVTDDPFGQNALYKHIQQSWILPTTDVEVTKFQEERKEEVDTDWDEHVRQVGKEKNNTEVVIVMGAPCSGKSTFIKDYFLERTVIDLLDFEKNRYTIPEILKAYEECRDALVQAIKDGKQVVLEHTLLRQIRRSMYVDAIREVTDAPIHIYVMLPSEDKVKAYCKKERISVDLYYDNLGLLELPTKEEGFDKIYEIH